MSGLICELAEYERLTHEVRFDERQLGDFLFGPRPYAEVLLAEEAGAVVGFALFFHNFSTFVGKPGIYLEDLYVRPEHRGRGHGKALLRAVASVAVERGCGRMEWSVLDWNKLAIEFYESLGAVALDDWTVYRLTGEALQTVGTSQSFNRDPEEPAEKPDTCSAGPSACTAFQPPPPGRG